MAATDPDLPAIPPRPNPNEAAGAAVGTWIDDYQLVEYLGCGGMADVYVARRRAPWPRAARLALKRLRWSLCDNPRIIERFVHEARVCTSLRHPNLVRGLDFGLADGVPYLVLELVDGMSCNELLKRTRAPTLPFGVALGIVGQVLDGLKHLHALRGDDGKLLNIVHLDIAPDNIVVTQSGTVTLLDFGIAQSGWRPDAGPQPELCGKLGYMSPEQIGGLPTDWRSDLFSAGIVLAELVLGRHVFGAQSELGILVKNFNADLAALDTLDEPMRGALLSLLRRALARAPADRFSSARAFRRALGDIARTSGVRTDPDSLRAWFESRGLTQPPSAKSRVRVMHATLLARRIDRVSARLSSAVRGRAPPPAPGLPAAARRRTPADELRRSRTLARSVEQLVTGQRSRQDRGVRDAVRAARVLNRIATQPAYDFEGKTESPASWRMPIERRLMPAVFFQLGRSAASGVLTARDGKRRKRVFFDAGTPSFVASSDPGELFGNRLVTLGLLEAARLDSMVALACHRGRLGSEVIEAGVLSAANVLRLLVSELEARVLQLGGWEAGELTFTPGLRPGVSVPRPLLDATHLGCRLVRCTYTDEEIATFVGPLGDAPLTAAVGSAEARSALGLTPLETAVIDAPASSLRERIAAGRKEQPVTAEPVRRAIFLALSAGLLLGPCWWFDEPAVWAGRERASAMG